MKIWQQLCYRQLVTVCSTAVLPRWLIIMQYVNSGHGRVQQHETVQIYRGMAAFKLVVNRLASRQYLMCQSFRVWSSKFVICIAFICMGFVSLPANTKITEQTLTTEYSLSLKEIKDCMMFQH